MGKEVQIKLKVHLLRVVRKKPLILKVNQVRGILVKVKENQEADRSQNLRRKLKCYNCKNMDITLPSI
jgi:cytochrome c-type biogenesis protein CcmH/NrfF